MHIHIHSQIATGSYFHKSGGDEKPSQISGIPGCVFVHADGYIGANLT